MDVRDAVEADADQMAKLTGSPTDVMRNLVHDRTVRIACETVDNREQSAENVDSQSEASDRDESGETVEGIEPQESVHDTETLGFVSFDAQRQTVHITQIDGTKEACERLLEEPIRFARQEGMSVELLVADGDDDLQSIAVNAGFTDHGAGPRFGSTSTVRFRMDTK